MDDVDLHTRLVGHRSGRVAVGIGLVVVAFWIVGPNMPASGARSRIDALWRPAESAGLVQDWEVFSPNPRDQSLDVRALVEHDDDSVEFWDVPEFDPIVGAYRQYRWNKWQERVRLDDESDLWESTAEWIADQNLRDGVRPRRVTLVRRWIDHEPLADDGRFSDSGWNEAEFFTWERDT